MQHKVREQQRLLEQQQQQKQQEDLYRLQQAAFMERQREEQEKQVHLMRMQQEALMQDDEQMAVSIELLSFTACIVLEHKVLLVIQDNLLHIILFHN